MFACLGVVQPDSELGAGGHTGAGQRGPGAQGRGEGAGAGHRHQEEPGQQHRQCVRQPGGQGGRAIGVEMLF